MRDNPLIDTSSEEDDPSRRQTVDSWPTASDFEPLALNDEIWEVFCHEEDEHHLPEIEDYWDEEDWCDDV